MLANRNYLIYIATRENVDLGNANEIANISTEEILSRLKKEEKIADSGETDNASYLKYMSDRPRSHGLFGNIDTSDLKKLSSDISRMTGEGKNIYKVIISLSELDAKLLGHTNNSSWNKYLQATMPDFAEALGLSSFDFSWVAAYHAERSHPHVHVMIWNNRDKIKSPFISVATQNKCRKVLSDHMFDEKYEKTLKDLLKKERDELILQKNVSRDNITDEFKKIFLSSTYVPGNMIESLPDKLKTGELKELDDKLKELVDILPDKGKMNYQFMPREVKMKINDITDQLFARNDFKEHVQSYVNASVEIQKMQGKVKKELDAVRKRAMGELYTRSGNIILKGLKSQINIMKSDIDAKNGDIEYKIRNDSEKNKVAALSFERKLELERKLEFEKKVDELIDLYSSPDWWDPKVYKQMRLEDEIRSQAFWSDYEYEAYRLLNTSGQRKLYNLGKKYISNGRFRGPKLAYDFFKKSADCGNKFAMYQLGRMYLRGYEKAEIYKDIGKAEYWFLKSSELENSWADYQLGKLYEREESVFDIEKSLEYYNRSAVQGNNTAMYHLGCIYYFGQGVDVNKSEGIKWLDAAAQQENKYAQCLLGDICMNKFSDNYDFLKAVELYKKSAEQKYEIAMFRLGYIYIQGLCGKEKIHKGEELLESSIKIIEEHLEQVEKTENAYLEHYLGKFYASENAGKFYDIEKAIKYFELSSEHGKVSALHSLGEIYERKNDISKAIEYYKMAAEKGNDMSLYRLGQFYLEGEEVKANPEMGLELLHRSADEYANPYASYYLGNVYFEKKNMDLALRYWNLAADQNNDFAMWRIGHVYLWGIGVEKNVEEGLNWLHKAADKYENEYARSEIETYEKMSFQRLSYGLFKMIFVMVETEASKKNNQNKMQHERSKQAKKEYVIHHDTSPN